MNNPFQSKINPGSPSFTMGSMALVLGVLIGLAWVTKQDRPERLEHLPPEVRQRIQGGDISQVQDDMSKLQLQINELREKNTKYEETLAKQSGQAKALNDTLQELKVMAGLSDLIGPGIVVTLMDSQREDLPPEAGIIHDYDLLRIVNELWNADAEAIAIGNQRLVLGSSIRCVGSVVRVNDVPMAPPIKIYALGDPKTLEGALALPMGPLDEIRQTDPKMVQVEQLKEVKVPQFSGSASKRLSRVPEAKNP